MVTVPNLKNLILTPLYLDPTGGEKRTSGQHELDKAIQAQFKHICALYSGLPNVVRSCCLDKLPLHFDLHYVAIIPDPRAWFEANASLPAREKTVDGFA